MVKTCPKLVSGLNLAVDGLRACTRGALMPPLFCRPEDIGRGIVTRDFIVAKRKEYIRMLNDDHSAMDCKRCLMVERKRYGELSFSRLGHIDLQHYSICNLRCSYCAYTRNSLHLAPQYDALGVLDLFTAEDVEWNAHVDFAGGEPALLENLGDYLEFFRTRRIRVLLYTNAVRFHPAIYDGLADGSLYLVTTSVDAGTPSTFRAVRGNDRYLRVLENLSRYAAAGSRGKGMLCVKYIFCEKNCGDDDVAGFAYAMLALRPQQVWLTFDFAPLALGQSGHDYSAQIEAYAKLYLLLQKHGIEAFHYYKEAIATVSGEGKEIMDRILAAIDRQSSAAVMDDPDLKYANFRSREPRLLGKAARFRVKPLRLGTNGGPAVGRLADSSPAQGWSLAGKRVLLAPACPATQKLLGDPEIAQAEWIGFLDRNPVQQGKTIEGRMIYGYEAAGAMEVDAILVAAPEKHRLDILDSVARNAPEGVQIAELDGE
jgi:wyosine [tRNA(Phe)-imidazoG37] synthetase (radical SAM superfamily)